MHHKGTGTHFSSFYLFESFVSIYGLISCNIKFNILTKNKPLEEGKFSKSYIGNGQRNINILLVFFGDFSREGGGNIP